MSDISNTVEEYCRAIDESVSAMAGDGDESAIIDRSISNEMWISAAEDACYRGMGNKFDQELNNLNRLYSSKWTRFQVRSNPEMLAIVKDDVSDSEIRDAIGRVVFMNVVSLLANILSMPCDFDAEGSDATYSSMKVHKCQ